MLFLHILSACRIANSIDDIDMWQGQRAAFWLARKWDKRRRIMSAFKRQVGGIYERKILKKLTT